MINVSDASCPISSETRPVNNPLIQMDNQDEIVPMSHNFDVETKFRSQTFTGLITYQTWYTRHLTAFTFNLKLKKIQTITLPNDFRKI